MADGIAGRAGEAGAGFDLGQHGPRGQVQVGDLGASGCCRIWSRRVGRSRVRTASTSVSRSKPVRAHARWRWSRRCGPCRRPPGHRSWFRRRAFTTGAPPPPPQMTTTRPSMSRRMMCSSTMRDGARVRARLRRQAGPSGATVQPCRAASCSATSRGVDAPDELRGVGERRVVGGDDGLGDERGDRSRHAGVAQFLRQPVADHALGLGAERVQRVRLGQERSASLSSASRPTCGPLPWQMSSSCSAASGASAGRGGPDVSDVGSRRRACHGVRAARCRPARR